LRLLVALGRHVTIQRRIIDQYLALSIEDIHFTQTQETAAAIAAIAVPAAVAVERSLTIDRLE
jgi:hypothetical protein